MTMTNRERLPDRDNDMMCAMAKVKELPDELIDEYFEVKRLLDRIQAQMTPSCMAMLLLSMGCDTDHARDKEATRVKPDPPTDSPDVPARIEGSSTMSVGAAATGGTIADPDPEVVVGGPVEPEAEVEEPASDDLGDAYPEGAYTPGTKLEVYHEGELVNGEVTGAHLDDGDITYELKIEGVDDPVSVNEDDTELVE